MFSVIYAEGHLLALYAEYHYAECRGDSLTRMKHIKVLARMYYNKNKENRFIKMTPGPNVIKYFIHNLRNFV
jgi:hypothetical protein